MKTSLSKRAFITIAITSGTVDDRTYAILKEFNTNKNYCNLIKFKYVKSYLKYVAKNSACIVYCNYTKIGIK